MTTTELKAEVYHLIDRLDEPFLKVVHSMLDTYVQQQEDPIVGYDLKGQPLHANEANEVYSKRVAAMKAGQKTSIEDLQKRSCYMVRYKVSVSDEAKETLRNIYGWLKENESVSIAEKVKGGLLDEIAALSQFPDRYGIVQEIKNDQVVFRRILKWAYKIIFVIDEEGLEVLVVDITHAKQSPERLQRKNSEIKKPHDL